MSVIIQSSAQLLNIAGYIKGTDKKKSKITEKLSSGYRINRAADDSAGLHISERMRSLIRALDRGCENARDGISLVQIADGSLNEVQDMLQRMNELAIKSANGTNTKADRAAIEEEFNHLQGGDRSYHGKCRVQYPGYF